MRKASSNLLGKAIMTLVMGVLIVSFGVWGIGDIFRGFGQSTLAKVGSTEISIEQFRQLYTDRLQQLSRQFGRPITPDQARAFGLDRSILQQTLAETALDEGARKLGLAQSDAEVLKAIASDPNFRGINGQFDPSRFAQIIRQFGYNESRYIGEQRRVALRRQLAGTVTDGLEPNPVQVEAMARFQNEQRSIEYVKLTPAQAGTIEAPSPEALATYYDENKTAFRAPEYRRIAILTVTPASLTKADAISDEDVRKLYEQRKATLSTPEKREVSQIVFPSMDAAKAAREKIVAGTPFADVAKEAGFSAADTDLGLVTKTEIADPAVADAVFALPANEISQPIQGRFGAVLARVGKIEAGSTPTYESQAPALRHDLAMERARATIEDLRNKMEDERGGGANVVDAASKLGLTATVIEAVDRSGRGPDGKPVAGLPAGTDVIAKAFDSDVGVENDPISFEGGYLWFDVLGTTPSQERPLDQVRDQVEARWREDQITKRLRDKAREMLEQLGKGTPFADIAKSADLKLETALGFKRDGAFAGVPTSVVQQVFRAAKGDTGEARAAGNDFIIYRVTDIVAPPFDPNSEDAKKIRDTISRALADEQVGEYVGGLEQQLGTQINQAAFAQITGAGSN